MKTLFQYSKAILFAVVILAVHGSAFSQTEEGDTLAFPFQDNSNDPLNSSGNGGLYLSTPSNVNTNVVYNPETGQYEIKQTLGDTLPYRPPTEIGLEEYLDYSDEKSKSDYWKLKSAEQRQGLKTDYRPQLDINNEVVDKIFGGSTVDIKPTGSAELRFGGQVQHTENPQVPVRNRTVGTFQFDMKIQLNVIGTVGDKMKLTTSYNTEANFDFQNQMKLEYTGYEDEIIKKIEAGNVSLPLNGSLITGSQTLFGIKTQLQFGRLMVTSVFSRQNGKKSEITVEGGAQIQEFEVGADSYEQNKHFFLAHYFRDNYEQAVENPPIINSLINITRVEVWVTNNNNTTENTRNVIGFQDLGERKPENIYNMNMAYPNMTSGLPSNDNNMLYETMNTNGSIRGFTYASTELAQLNMKAKKDYQKVELARKLAENEYFIHPQLGYISLKQELNLNQMLAVAFQYTYQGETYQVGEFSDDIQGQQSLYLKLLKTTERNTRIPMWDLMMKNIYAIGAYNVQKEGFKLEVWYLNANTGVENNYLPEGPEDVKEKQLISVLGLDKLTVTNIEGKDGVFDYIDNPRMTINPQNGRVIFPVLEPFGSHLHEMFDDEVLAAKYAFDSLYTNTRTNAQVKFPDQNRFTIRGETKSAAGSEISLGQINIPEGSVVVTSGGVPLTENSDYIVDYNLGRVTIINPSILESGTPIKVSLESQQLFNIQPKTLFATRFDYTISEDLVLGGTVMNYSEQPNTFKVNQGVEPISNTIVGVDGNYKTESQTLTNLVDKIPLIDTKEKSNIIVGGEVAKLFPGSARAIDFIDGEGETAFIDDFEGSQTAIDIKSGTATSWMLASTPQGQPQQFPEGELVDDLAYGFNRAKLAWYTIDPLFYPSRNDPNMPDHIDSDPLITDNHFMREVRIQEVFKQRSANYGQFNNIVTLDMAYYPEERGPYNYDVDGMSNGVEYGHGINEDGTLKEPEKRWAGIMRELQTNDFEAANVEYIQFWIMDPFAESGNPDYPDMPQDDLTGKIYFNIGQISEDILRDGRKTFEQGMPQDEQGSQNLNDSSTFSNWGRIPPIGTQAVVNAFVNNPTARPHQDVGLDGLRDEEEQIFFDSVYVKRVEQAYGPASQAFENASDDPSGDNYNFFRDDDYDALQYDVLTRYKQFNGLEGNSPTSEQYQNENADGYPTTSTQRPHVEDINNDNTLDEVESYYEYSIEISKAGLSTVGRNHLTNILESEYTTPGDVERPIKWYQFKIPIEEFDKAVGGISDFRSMRFIRVYMKGFEKPVYIRFAQLQLTRGQWRKYKETMYGEGEQLNEESIQNFNIGALNIEENSEKTPVNYVLPPGINREQTWNQNFAQFLNEQSMTLEICDLEDGSANAAYKNVELDLRRYKRLRMFSHAEAFQDQALEDGDLRLFVRLGTDFEDNFYEYEIPLSVTQPDFYRGDDPTEQEKVWPQENNVDLLLEDLWGIKLKRNQAIIDGKHASAHVPYDSTLLSGANIYVVGNPNLSEVKTIMIGVRNPRQDLDPTDTDDGLAKCATVWVNELRLTEFDENGGWAAIGRVQANFADLANVSASGSIRTKGFGSVEQKVNERQKETIKTADVSSTVQLGKFIPEKVGVRLPMYVGLSVVETTPEFSPLAEDVPTAEYENAMTAHLPSVEAIQEKSELRKMTRDITTRKSLNFANIRKEKAKGSDRKTRFYDITNWTGTYAYTEENHTNFELEKDLIKTYKGGLSYNFNASPKNITPFSKVKFLRKSKYLQLIKDFNFYPGPKQLGFRTDVNRMYNERQIRNVNPGVTATIDPLYNKSFTWSRSYNFKYDLTKALKFDFTANANALIDEKAEQIGKIDRRDEKDEYDIFRESVMESFSNGGMPLNYRHNTNINYTIPFSKFPLTNWISSTARYSTSYTWTRAPFAAEHFGNTIQNTQQYNLNAQFNMVTLYNKVGYLKKVNNKFRGSGRSSRSRSNSKGKGDGKDDKKKDKSKNKNSKKPWDYAARTLMSVRNLSATYSMNRGTLMPGYEPQSQVLGMEQFTAPGYGFIFGQQDGWGGTDSTFAQWARMNNWLRADTSINTQFARTRVERFSYNGTIEPIKDFRIQVKGNMDYAFNQSEFYRYQGYEDAFGNGVWKSESPVEMGNYSSSIIAISTAFADPFNSETSNVYEQFLENRATISQRLSEEDEITEHDHLEHENDAGYAYGYGSASKQVLVPAFLSAYTGTSAKTVSLDPTRVGYNNSRFLPLPNWSVRYNGLSKIKALKKYVRKISLNHSYQSSYNLTGYTTNLDYKGLYDGMQLDEIMDQSQNYEWDLVVNTVTISERFSPLINIDMTFQNSFQSKLEIKRDRMLSLNIANTQLTETKGMEYVLGMGYEIKRVKLPFQLRQGVDIISPLKLRADVSYRQNVTIIRKIIEDTQQVTSGQDILSAKVTADYNLSKALRLRGFCDYSATWPKTSNTFNRWELNFGVSVLFTLSG